MKKTVLALAILTSISTMSKADSSDDSEQLFGLDLAQLMNIKVVSATKRQQTLADTAAAMHVISREDIRRSGATNIPELLKQAPGVEVARINASTWAVTVRGFQGQFANKLLVLIDGRSVYTPLFSGVYWDAQMPMLESIDRIEVIRGPGSSLWGSNAVNGVINIITKNASDTLNTIVTVGAGDIEQGLARASTGIEYGNASTRLYAQARSVADSQDQATSDSANDAYITSAIGFRTDLQTDTQDQITIQGDYLNTDKDNNIALHPYAAYQIENFSDDNRSDNANILTRWKHPYDNGDSHELQAYIDWVDRQESTYEYQRTTADIDYQYNVQKTGRQQITLGINYRFISDHFEGSYGLEMQNPDLDYDQGTAFVQDEIQITDELAAIFGLKFESTAFSDFKYQPTARLLWTPSDDLTFWAAASRAIRTPSRISRGMTVRAELAPEVVERYKLLVQAGLAALDTPIYLPLDSIDPIGQLSGSSDFREESLTSFEIGYRHQITPSLFVDATTYYNDYHHLRTFDPGVNEQIFPTSSYPKFVYVVDYDYGNETDAHSTGAELAANWYPIQSWQLKLAYTYFNMVAEPYDDHSGLGIRELSEQSPLHQAYLRSQHDINDQWEFDWTLKYFGGLPDDEIDSYTDMDIKVTYMPSESLEISLVGKDLFASPRMEFQDTIIGPYATEITRSIFLQATWRSL